MEELGAVQTSHNMLQEKNLVQETRKLFLNPNEVFKCIEHSLKPED